MIEIVLAGRTDVDDYFKQVLLTYSKLTDTPLLVFLSSEDKVEVRIVDKPGALLSFPDNTLVMGQWRGQWRSDYFQFNVGKYRIFANKKYEHLKSATNVVKTVGPNGGFKWLAYEYTTVGGMKVHESIQSKEESEKIEAILTQLGIPIKIEKQSSR